MSRPPHASACTGVALISVGADGPQRTHWVAGATAAAAPGAAGLVLAAAAADKGGRAVRLQLLNPATGAQLDSSTVQLPVPGHPVHGPTPHIVGAWLAPTPTSASSSSSSSSSTGALSHASVLLHWSDDALLMVTNSSVAWMREEALASATQSLFVDLPAAPRGAAAAPGSGGLLSRLQEPGWLQRWGRLQLLSALVQFHLAAPQERAEFRTLRAQLRCAGCVCWGGAMAQGQGQELVAETSHSTPFPLMCPILPSQTTPPCAALQQHLCPNKTRAHIHTHTHSAASFPAMMVLPPKHTHTPSPPPQHHPHMRAGRSLCTLCAATTSCLSATAMVSAACLCC
jgi:hypothetical protein